MKTALQFSGGKDSLALLHLLRPHWGSLIVYWLNTGDTPAEVISYMAEIKALVPNFIEIEGKQPETIAAFGWPSDVVPSSDTAFGNMSKFSPILLQDRGECCMRSLMLPMHERMKLDGIERIIRGQKLCDVRKSPIRDGDSADGFVFSFPLENWSEEDVFTYLQANGIPLPSYYEELKASPDCLHCTGYWDEARWEFLRKGYPDAWEIVSTRIHMIKVSVQESMRHLEGSI